MPVNIQGRSYATVAERLGAAHGNDVKPQGIASLRAEIEVIGEYTICRAEITFTDGRTFVGTAEVTRGTGRGPQASSPIETAETSAIGRALAAAGYFGSDDGIAGAEEVRIAQGRGTPAPVRLGGAVRVVDSR